MRTIFYTFCFWLSRFCDNKIIIYSNNTIVVVDFNKKSIRDDSIDLLRNIAIFLVFNNILIESI